ncbi:leucine rich repeat domain-containing protein [Ditylenchus destructor]|nr:leucine rich repeat domain-containing protein [Ditylenchus destructor]
MLGFLTGGGGGAKASERASSIPHKQPFSTALSSSTGTSRHSLRRLRLKTQRPRQATRDSLDSADCSTSLDALGPSTSTAHQNALLNRPIDQVFEEAQLSMFLNLCGRKMKEINAELWHSRDLSDLICADFESNQLVDLPPLLFLPRPMESLESLVLRCNCMRGLLPATISSLKSLTYLDLSGNRLNSLPESLFFLRLKVLLLGSNRLENINPEIRRLGSCLEELDISDNRLKTLPIETGQLAALRVLNLSGNMLESLPQELGLLAHTLKVLDLSNNRLTHLPSQLHHIAGSSRSGIQLFIGHNPLISPPLYVVRKGRLHIAKWLASLAVTESSNDDRLNNNVYARSTNSCSFDTKSRCEPLNGTLVNGLLSKNVGHLGHQMSINLAGSDSGYASTASTVNADEHRLSHEYTGGSLEDIRENGNITVSDYDLREKLSNEAHSCSGDLAKEVMLAYAESVMQKRAAKEASQAATVTYHDPKKNNSDCKFRPLENAKSGHSSEKVEQPGVAAQKTLAVPSYQSKTTLNTKNIALSPVDESAPSMDKNFQCLPENALKNMLPPENVKEFNTSLLLSSCSSSMCSVVENLPTATIKMGQSGRQKTPAKNLERPMNLENKEFSKINDARGKATTNKTSESNKPTTTIGSCNEAESGITADLTGTQSKIGTKFVKMTQNGKTQISRNGTVPTSQIKRPIATNSTVNGRASRQAASSVVANGPAGRSALTASTNRVYPTSSSTAMSKSTVVPRTTTNSVQLRKERNVKADSIPPPDKKIPQIVKKANSTLNLQKKLPEPTTTLSTGKSAHANSAAIQEMCQLIWGENPPCTDVNKLMDRLTDGVELCQFINKVKPKAVSVVLTPSGQNESVLPPTKARRNVENFLAACRRIGVTEASLCTTADILGRNKNLTQLAHTVIALRKVTIDKK